MTGGTTAKISKHVAVPTGETTVVRVDEGMEVEKAVDTDAALVGFDQPVGDECEDAVVREPGVVEAGCVDEIDVLGG